MGVLDGLNEDGLAVSLTFGGRRIVGEGFGVPLLLRYILEFCTTTREAVEVLKRVPTHMAYNITVLDRSGAFMTVFIAPTGRRSLSRFPSPPTTSRRWSGISTPRPRRLSNGNAF